MKQLIIVVVLAMTSVGMWATTNANINRANQAYKQELYNEALTLYLQEAKQLGVSSALYTNIGDTYYRLKDNAHAILYYERALLLDPANGDARFNLEFVRSKMQLPDDAGDSWFSNWLDGAVSRLSSNQWAIIAIVSFLLFLVAVSTYLFVSNVSLRKLGFFGGAALLLIAILANVAAFYVYDKTSSHNAAIVMPQSVTLSKAPRVPKDHNDEAFTLQQGTKVHIIDRMVTTTSTDSTTVAQNTANEWLQVQTAGGHSAWLHASDVEII